MGNVQGKGSKKRKETEPAKTTAPAKVTIPRFQAKPTDAVEEHYQVLDTVLGSFSVVKLGKHKATGQPVAVKIVEKLGNTKTKPEMIANEIKIMLQVDHPNVIALLDIFETDEKLYLIMELVTGGELFERIIEREQFREAEAKVVMRQLFAAIDYLHSLGIVHRDLKPENLLLEGADDETQLKVTDFGLSKIYSSEMMQTACGTPGYVAPEILGLAGYSFPVDLWSAGVIMYIMLCGYPPFYNDSPAQLFETIMQGVYEFHSPYWDPISSQAKDLIRKLLVVDPEQRLTAAQAAQHPWFAMVLLVTRVSHSKRNDSSLLHSEMRTNLTKTKSTRTGASLLDVQKAAGVSNHKSDTKKDKDKKKK